MKTIQTISKLFQSFDQCQKFDLTNLHFLSSSSSEVISHSDMRKCSIIAARDFFDWCVAISFMPEGWLYGLLPWAGNIYYYQIGLLGMAATYCRSLHYVVNKQE